VHQQFYLLARRFSVKNFLQHGFEVPDGLIIAEDLKFLLFFLCHCHAKLERTRDDSGCLGFLTSGVEVLPDADQLVNSFMVDDFLDVERM
jgi:hypothetical protein